MNETAPKSPLISVALGLDRHIDVDGRHVDGHGLNDVIKIEADERDKENGGGASHFYELWMPVVPKPTIEAMEETLKAAPHELRLRPDGVVEMRVARIQFQHGPRNEPRSAAGITEAALLAVLLDRLYAFQAGPFSCRENAIQITKLEEAMHWTKHRADERARRGVLGKNVK